MGVRSVVLDLGGVLIDWNPRHLYCKLFDDAREMEAFLASVCTAEWHYQHDLGRPFEQTCSELGARFPEHEEMITAWARQDEMVAGAVDDTVRILGELRDRGVATYALSNWSVAFPRMLERFEFLSWFDGMVVSSQEGVAKPDPIIFERLLERYDLDPDSTLFVDDSSIHVETARDLGMRTYLFTTSEVLAAELRSLGLL